ncbi:unnamed protein product [Mycena citricolor]|uniref:Protein kinase domain-containing protein n=1 Tax=Mycena citricolor TaxID=2018698 RepID=A0AAD2K270_9AGAR|nr:unnamed protein product [Mycena citricolor]
MTSFPLHSTMHQPHVSSPLVSSSSESDNSSDSEATLEDLDWSQENALQRLPGPGPTRSLHTQGVSHSRPDSACSDVSWRSSSSSENSSVVYDIDFESLIDELMMEEPFPLSESRNTVAVAASHDAATDSMLIKYLHESSPELLITLRLNHDQYRDDPWNPIPHILCAVHRDDHVFLCLQRLVEFNEPPLKNVANCVDFFRQVLEGLTFLHEHSIGQLSSAESVRAFDRTLYPVRYYLTNLASACELDSLTDEEAAEIMRRDVRECAEMMENVGESIPVISTKLVTLVTAMKTGTFDADASRKLFEALCKSLPSEVFDLPAEIHVSTTHDHTPEARVHVPAKPEIRSSPSAPLLHQRTAGPLHTINLLRKPKSSSITPQSLCSPPQSRSVR